MSKEIEEYSPEFIQALQELPYRIYEKEFFKDGATVLCFTFLLLSKDLEFVRSIPPIVLSIASATTYVLGRVLDTGSTISSLTAIQEANNLEIVNGFGETNLFFRNNTRPTPHEFISSRKQMLDYALAAVVPLWPAVGVLFGIRGMLCAIQNKRATTILERSIEIKQQTKLA